jgi:chromosome segregation and condensation protein ScpB
MCGVPLATPIDREIEITPGERELCDRLLAAVLEEWKQIKGSSVAALRETYLHREGRLVHLTSGWRLRVQRKTVDVLMDSIGWPISTIAFSWMAEPLFVTW